MQRTFAQGADWNSLAAADEGFCSPQAVSSKLLHTQYVPHAGFWTGLAILPHTEDAKPCSENCESVEEGMAWNEHRIMIDQ